MVRCTALGMGDGWFVLVPYSKEYDLFITHFHRLSANIIDLTPYII